MAWNLESSVSEAIRVGETPAALQEHVSHALKGKAVYWISHPVEVRCLTRLQSQLALRPGCILGGCRLVPLMLFLVVGQRRAAFPHRPFVLPRRGRPRAGGTKRLLFSSWMATPSAVASILSYEADRRITEQALAAGQEETQGRARLTYHCEPTARNGCRLS